MKGFKFLVFGTIIAKIFGLLRELLILTEFGYSLEISSYFSLIAVLSIFTFFSDTSIINSIAYPLWIESKKVYLKINTKISLIIIGVIPLIFFYNYFFFNSINNNHLKILIAVSVIPLILNSILYSVLIFLDKKKEFLIIASSNGVIYFFATFYLLEFGLLGLIYSRLITLFLTLAIILIIVKNDVKFFFGEYAFEKGLIQKSFKRFLNVNNVLLFAITTRLLSSFIFENKMAVINYSMLIILTFYTVFSKNLNTQLIKNQIKEATLNNKIKGLYFFASITFLLLLLLSLVLIPNKIDLLGKTIELAIPLKLSFFLFLPIILLGFIDLTQQSELSRMKKIKFTPFVFCLGYYVLVLSFFKIA